MKIGLFLATLMLASLHPSFAQMGAFSSTQRPAGPLELLFGAHLGRDDIVRMNQQSGLYAAYGIMGVPGQVAMNPRIQGPLRMIGGGMEVLGGGYYTGQTGGLGRVLGGGLLMANGADNFWAGWQMTSTGQYQQSILESAFTSRLGPGWGSGAYAATQLGMGGVPWAAARIPNIPGIESAMFNPGNYRFPQGAFYSGIPIPEYTPPGIIMVDPATLRLPPSRMIGANPFKLLDQTTKYGSSVEGMPPLLLIQGAQNQLSIWDGVTRATRAMSLSPGILVPARIIEVRPTWNIWGLPRVSP